MMVADRIQILVRIQIDRNRSKSSIFTDFCEFRDFESNYSSKNVILEDFKGVEFDFDFCFTFRFSDRDPFDRIYRFLPIFVIFSIQCDFSGFQGWEIRLKHLFYSFDFLLIDIEPIIIDYLILPILAFLDYKSDLTTKGVISGVVKGDELDSDTHFTLRFDNFNRIVSIGRTGSRLESRGSIKRFKRRLHLFI